MRHTGKQGLWFRPNLFYFLPFVVWGGLTVFLLFFVFRHVDLKPRVGENFFFSSDDPQLQTDRLISKMFSQEQQIILSAKGDIRSPDYLRKVRELTSELASIPGIDTVQSLTQGPRSTDDALESPLWKRVLFSEDQKASFIYVFLKEKASVKEVVLKIERIKQHFESPDFPLMISGAPYIVELIQRNFLHGLKVFSIVAFCVFGLSGLLISRSVAMVLGTLIACTNASTLNLILTHVFRIPIGPLTANLSTIVFVLTLTHMVFMTFNWQHIIEKKETSVEKASWRADNVCAFSRRMENAAMLVATPRLFTKLIQRPGDVPLGKTVWNDCFVILPFETPGALYRNLFTGETVKTIDLKGLTILYFSAVFSNFPVALMGRD